MFKIFVFLSFSLLLGCGSSEPVAKTEPAKPTVETVKSETKPVEKAEEKPIDWSSTRVAIDVKKEVKVYGLEDAPLLLNPPKKEPEAPKKDLSLTKEKKGYRIQIFTTNSKRTADEIQAEARNVYGYKVYVSFRAPMYSIKIGNYATIDQAKLDLDKVLEQYKHATVIPDFIGN